jgi:hypothetical protein
MNCGTSEATSDSRLAATLTMLAVALLVGCVPEERIWWSPSGKRALVVMNEQIHLVQADGTRIRTLTELPLGEVAFPTACWLPDETGFVCVTSEKLASWEEVVRILPPSEVAQVDAMMPLVLQSLAAAVRLSPGTTEFTRLLSHLQPDVRAALVAATMRTYATGPEKVEAALAPLKDAKAIMESLRKNGPSFQMNAVCHVLLDDQQATQVKVLNRSLLSGYVFPKVCPNGDFIAMLVGVDGKDDIQLVVHSLRDDSKVTVTTRATPAFEWMPDGKSLCYFSPLDGRSQTICVLNRARVLNDEGKLVDAKVFQPSTHVELLATVLVTKTPALRVLPDGRLLLAGQPATFPFTGSDLKEEPKLYLLCEDGQTLAQIPTATGALPTDLGHFSLSPDGKRVAVVEGGTNAVALVELDSGKTDLIHLADDGWRCRLLPAWRSSDELIFAGLHGGKPDLMRWTSGKGVERFGQDWSADTDDKWLEARTNDSL